MNTIIKRLFLILFGFSVLVSCIEEQDFDQYDELRATPTVEASILYIETPESFINAAAGIDVITRDFNFNAFSADLFAERVLDGTVTYIVENTTSKPVDIFVELLDVNGNVLDTERIESDANMVNHQVDIAYGNSGKSINIIKNTSSIRVTARNMGDSTSVSDNPEPKIILKSSGKFRLELK